MTTTATPVGPIKQMKVAALRPHEGNPRNITDQRFADLKKSLQADPEMMQARPLIALTDGRVICGNMRLRAAQELGWDKIACVTVELDEERARLWMLRDNQEYGEWDEAMLAEMVYDLSTAGVDLDLSGFDSDAVQKILDDVAGSASEPEPDKGSDLALADVSIGEPRNQVRTGEVWQLGNHILVCCDVYEGWPTYTAFLEGDALLVPYPMPTLPLTERARKTRLVMVQPDPFLAGHVIDKYEAIFGAAEVQKR